MTSMQRETSKTRDGVSKFIAQETARRLELEDVSNELKHHIQQSIEEKTGGSFLWADMILDTLSWRSTEVGIENYLTSAPGEIEEKLIESLELYGENMESKDTEGLNALIAWISHAARPLTIVETDAVIWRLISFVENDPSWEGKWKDTYYPFLKLFRVKGYPQTYVISLLRVRCSSTRPH
jgi:hypothetical protein